MIGVQVILVPSDKWFKGNICTVFHKSTEEDYLNPRRGVENEFEDSIWTDFFFFNYLFISIFFSIYLFHFWLHGVLAEAHRILCCGTWAYLPCGMWDLGSPPGIEPVSPALEGRFLTMGPPGKSLN